MSTLLNIPLDVLKIIARFIDDKIRNDIFSQVNRLFRKIACDAILEKCCIDNHSFPYPLAIQLLRAFIIYDLYHIDINDIKMVLLEYKMRISNTPRVHQLAFAILMRTFITFPHKSVADKWIEIRHKNVHRQDIGTQKWTFHEYDIILCVTDYPEEITNTQFTLLGSINAIHNDKLRQIEFCLIGASNEITRGLSGFGLEQNVFDFIRTLTKCSEISIRQLHRLSLIHVVNKYGEAFLRKYGNYTQ